MSDQTNSLKSGIIQLEHHTFSVNQFCFFYIIIIESFNLCNWLQYTCQCIVELSGRSSKNNYSLKKTSKLFLKKEYWISIFFKKKYWLWKCFEPVDLFYSIIAYIPHCVYNQFFDASYDSLQQWIISLTFEKQIMDVN